MVGAEPAGDRFGLSFPLVEEDLEHLRDAVRLNAGADHVFHGLFVRFALIIAAEPREQSGAAHLNRSARRVAVAHVEERASQHHADIGPLRLLHLLHGMPTHHVPDLVAQNTGQLAHVGQWAMAVRGCMNYKGPAMSLDDIDKKLASAFAEKCKKDNS